jgi:hypothetical protein
VRAWDLDVMPVAGGRRDGLTLAVVCVRRRLRCCPLSLSYRIGKGADFLFGGAKSGMSSALLIDKAQLSIGYRLRLFRPATRAYEVWGGYLNGSWVLASFNGLGCTQEGQGQEHHSPGI